MIETDFANHELKINMDVIKDPILIHAAIVLCAYANKMGLKGRELNYIAFDETKSKFTWVVDA